MLNCTTSQSSVSGRRSVGARGDDEIDENSSSIWTRWVRAWRPDGRVARDGHPDTLSWTTRRSVESVGAPLGSFTHDRTDDAEIPSDLLRSRAGKGYLVS